MSKKKVTLIYRFEHIFFHHPWLKLISLALAIITWLYINFEMLSR